ncbi:hypothetical protein DRJ23_02140 [Candidatus Acetothermia bacterium]|nr:MAG: hypothetical protein DRJ23_02140 [Candidatus Acetothermia bacterium]
MRTVIVALSLLILIGGLALGQEDSVSFSGSIGARATLLPSFGIASSVQASMTYAGFTLGSAADFDIYPSFGGSGSIWLEYAFGLLTTGLESYLDLTSLAISSIDAYADLTLFDLTSDNGMMSLSGELDMMVNFYPSFSSTLTGTVTGGFGPAEVKSTTIIDLLPFGFSSQDLSFTLTMFDTLLGEGGPRLAGKLGANFPVYPSFSGSAWVDMSATLDVVTFESKTTVSLIPFAFSSEYIKAEFDITPFSFYLATTLTTGSPQAELGASLSFP